MMAMMDNRKKAKDSAKKRPAACMKKPAGCAHVKHAIPTYDKKCRLVIPTAHGTLNYRGGRIYTIWGQRKFRAIKDLKKPSKEKITKWDKAKPSKEEWTNTVKAVDAYWDK
jgi:hypothetical protein